MFCCNCPCTAETYTLSLHDALPILEDPVGIELLADGGEPRLDRGRPDARVVDWARIGDVVRCGLRVEARLTDRKSTRLNSSHRCISYAVFCSKKKTQATTASHQRPT